MAENEIFDLDRLKRDPELWKRIAMARDENGKLERLFRGEENPFAKNSDAAMKRVKDLAKDGKLFVRENARARHFRKAELDGDNLKLGADKIDRKLATKGSDFVAGILLRLTRSYFEWVGINWLAKRIEKRIENRKQLIKEDEQYKTEFNALTKEEKKRLKQLRKQEKAEAKLRKKLAKLAKKTEETKQALNEVLGNTEPKDNEINAPLTNPPDLEANQVPAQPTLLGDNPPQAQKQEFVPTQVVQEQVLGADNTGRREEAPAQPQQDQVVVDGTAYTNDLLNAMPDEIKQAVNLLKTYAAQQKQRELELQQQQQQPAVPQVNGEAIENRQEVPPAQNQVVQEQNQVELHPVGQNQNGQPNENPVQVDDNAPLNRPADLEADRVNMQQPAERQEPTPLQQQLEAEKRQLDNIEKWKNQPNSEDYEYIAGTIFGILAGEENSPETKQQAVDALLSGEMIGEENQETIANGLAAFNDAMERNAAGDSGPMEKILANAIRELTGQINRENTLSPRLVMLGTLMTNVARMANEKGLQIPLEEDEMASAMGATTLAEVAQKYSEARQKLGNGIDLKNKECRGAVRDLLMGNAVEKMIQEDRKMGQEELNTHLLMGGGMWTTRRLVLFTSSTTTNRGIQVEQVQNLLKNPQSLDALKMGRDVGSEIAQASMRVQELRNTARQRELGGNAEQLQQPEINAPQQQQPFH